MSEQTAREIPIGYWLRKADAALTGAIDAVQQANGLSRLEWQLLHMLHERGPLELAGMASALGPVADTPAIVEAVERLVVREAVEAAAPEAPAYRLSASGRRLHADALRVQADLRSRAVAGIAEEDYATAVRVLQRIVENLEGSRP